MTPLPKYIVKSFILSASAVGLVGLAFFVAAGVFSETPIKIEISVASPPPISTAGLKPNSPLAGAALADSNHPTVANVPPDTAHHDWVEVVEGVNMRTGPTRSSSILAVKTKGTRMRVGSRVASWIEVVDPDTSEKGWIYQKFLREIPATKEAELADVNSR